MGFQIFVINPECDNIYEDKYFIVWQTEADKIILIFYVSLEENHLYWGTKTLSCFLSWAKEKLLSSISQLRKDTLFLPNEKGDGSTLCLEPLLE